MPVVSIEIGDLGLAYHEKVQGVDSRKLQQIVQKLAAEAEGGSSSSGFGGSSSGSSWRAGDLPKGYRDVTDQVDVKGLELLNADGEFGGVRTLFESSKPSALEKKGKADSTSKDWVESDTDEQLMLFMPFQSTLKVHTLQVLSSGPHPDTTTDLLLVDLPTTHPRGRRRRSPHAPKNHPTLHQPTPHRRIRRSRRPPCNTDRYSRGQGLELNRYSKRRSALRQVPERHQLSSLRCGWRWERREGPDR